MPFKKGVSGCPGGRTDPRKARSREAIARVVEGSADKIAGWIESIERDEGPKAALDAFIRLAEYALPKLARVEAVGDNGGPVETVHRIELAAAKALPEFSDV